MAIAQAVVGPDVLLKAESVPKKATARAFDRWRALAELGDKTRRMYEAQMKRMVQSIRDYVETNITTLKKAPPVLPMATPQQLAEIAQIIRDHHTAVTIRIGVDPHVDPAEVQRLIDQNILPPEALDIITDSYEYGRLVGAIRQFDDLATAKNFTYEQFRDRVKKRPIPLTNQEKAAIEWSKHSTAIHVKGLGNRIADDGSTVLINADAELRRKYVGEIRTAVQGNIERRETWSQLASDLGHQTKDWSRDFMRIAATEKQMAMQEGMSHSLMEREGDPKAILVAKIPKPDACEACVALHLKAGHGSAPKTFMLSELQDNGTNVKKKRPQWQATVGPVHPWCACELVHVPPGWKFEDEPADDEKDWEQVPNKRDKAWRKKKKNGEWQPWRSNLEPELRRSELSFKRDLLKAIVQYKDVPEDGVIVRVGDPEMRTAIEEVLSRTPPELLTAKNGVTVITTDISRPLVALTALDLAYWTGNEIRISQTLKPWRIKMVLEHELGHAPNVHLIRTLGGEPAVRAWHAQLDKVSQAEGYVSDYAKTHPIENAAEVSKLYLFYRVQLMSKYPRQFAFVHRSYKNFIPSPRFVVPASRGAA